MTKDYYQILGVSKDAELTQIKKAYRKLALQHHPDRNQGSAKSNERFKEISEAYEVLSDPEKRRSYDLGSASSTSHHSYSQSPSPAGFRYQSQYRDPFSQFDHLFRNDPFFNEAFRDMDDIFAQKFKNTQRSNNSTSEGWVPWLLWKCGIDFQMTTYSTGPDGHVSASTYSSKAGGSSEGKKTKTFRDAQGRLVTVRTVERNGNRIEDTYVGAQLTARYINGVKEPLQLDS